MPLGLTTRLLHADHFRGVEHGATHEPIHHAVAFGYDSARDLCAVFQGEKAGHVYGRQGSPTLQAVERRVTMMEEGTGTVSFSSGMAAITAVFWSLLRKGDHVVSSAFLFGNSNSLMQTLEALGCPVTLVDATDVAQVAAAIRPETRIVFTETIANPRTQIADLAGIGRLCAERGLLYVVDNTMTTPYLFRPADVGAGLSVNSLTKSISGHGNALGGAVTDTGKYDWTTYPNILDSYKKGAPSTWGLLQVRKKGLRDTGGTLSGDNAHRIATGAETLALRMDRACDNAMKLATWLAAQPGITKVHYPGLPDHPEHARAKALFSQFGALLSFELAEGRDLFAFLDALKVVIKSSHLGDNRTLVIPVAHTIFFEMGRERRLSMGIEESLIRVSVGIEDHADLQADFAAALAATGG
jgi:O-acetylhomoserine (thiol)-lyase